MIGRAHTARPQTDVLGPISRAIGAVGRLAVPVLLLLTVGAAAFIYAGEKASWLGNIDIGGKPLSVGHLFLPLSFFVVHLTNRRYGAGYAIAQIFLAWIVAMGSLPYTQNVISILHEGSMPELRTIAGFGAGLFIAQIVSVFVFDRLRGPQWWQAPLIASVLGGVVMCAIAYPLAYAGSGIAWTNPMFDYMGVLSAIAIVMVVPYWALRSMVPPLSGFGGY